MDGNLLYFSFILGLWCEGRVRFPCLCRPVTSVWAQSSFWFTFSSWADEGLESAVCLPWIRCTRSAVASPCLGALVLWDHIPLVPVSWPAWGACCVIQISILFSPSLDCYQSAFSTRFSFVLIFLPLLLTVSFWGMYCFAVGCLKLPS